MRPAVDLEFTPRLFKAPDLNIKDDCAVFREFIAVSIFEEIVPL